MAYVLVIWPEGTVDLWQQKGIPCPLLGLIFRKSFRVYFHNYAHTLLRVLLNHYNKILNYCKIIIGSSRTPKTGQLSLFTFSNTITNTYVVENVIAVQCFSKPLAEVQTNSFA